MQNRRFIYNKRFVSLQLLQLEINRNSIFNTNRLSSLCTRLPVWHQLQDTYGLSIQQRIHTPCNLKIYRLPVFIDDKSHEDFSCNIFFHRFKRITNSFCQKFHHTTIFTHEFRHILYNLENLFIFITFSLYPTTTSSSNTTGSVVIFIRIFLAFFTGRN